MKKRKDQSIGTIKFKNFVRDNKILLGFVGAILLLGAVFFISADSSGDKWNGDKVFGDDVIELYYFHLNTCPHCHKQNAFMESYLLGAYPNVKVIEYEMTRPESIERYVEFAKVIEGLDEARFPGTPLTIVDGEYNIGYDTDENSGRVVEQMVLSKNKEINDNWDESTMKRTIDLN